MGPRFFNRGNSPNVDTQVNGGNGLQWGRGFSTAETMVRREVFAGLFTLQWGRGFSTAETRS